MSTLKGTISIKNPSIDKIIPLDHFYSKPVEFVNSNGNDLSKNVFYACESCNGPLIPISTCTFCKRASLRKCTKCGKSRKTQPHESCMILISFGNKITKKYTKEVKI